MFSFITILWQRSSLTSRLALVIAVLLIIILPLTAIWWLNKPDYQVLFSDMDNQDISAVISELDNKKIPYVLSNEGRTIEVDKAVLYKTRMQLLGNGVNFKGNVGFELFNTAEFGVSDFAQKINFQRALQGELARTILAFDEVQNVRVHLVLPETGMLRRNKIMAKASVWVTLKNGNQLSHDQVRGIQRLVAASVADLSPDEVTVLDNRGIALAGREGRPDEGMMADASLRLKKELEHYISQKIATILDTALNTNETAISVDVLLDPLTIRTSRESIITNSESGDRGVMVRHREQWQNEVSNQANSAKAPVNRKIEHDYQVGKEIQQILSNAGTIQRISVGIVTRGSLSDQSIERLRFVIAMAIGLDVQRGDGIAFSVFEPDQPQDQTSGVVFSQSEAQPLSITAIKTPNLWMMSVCAALLIVIILLLVLLQRSRSHTDGYSLSETERQQLLNQIRRWLVQDEQHV